MGTQLCQVRHLVGPWVQNGQSWDGVGQDPFKLWPNNDNTLYSILLLSQQLWQVKQKKKSICKNKKIKKIKFKADAI